MRILFVLDVYYPSISGGTIAPDRIAKALAKAGHTVGIIAPSEDSATAAQAATNPSIFYISAKPIPLVKFAQDMRIATLPFSQVKQAIDDFKPDIIHIHHFLLIGLAAQRYAKERDIPIISTNHFMPENLVHNLTPDSMKRLEPLAGPFNELLWKFVVNFCNNSDLVTSPSGTAINLLQEHGLESKAVAVSNGIDTTLYGQDLKNVGIAKKYVIPLNKPILMYLGRIDGEKRIEDILLAAKSVLKKYDCTVVIAGKGHYRAHLESLADQLGIASNIVFTGFVPNEEMEAMYGLGDIFVMPSPVELQSVSTMEAMATGLPVVSVHAGALFELVQQGKNGYLYETSNIFELSEYLCRLLGDKKARLQASKWSKEIIKQHDMKNVVLRLEELYASILK